MRNLLSIRNSSLTQRLKYPRAGLELRRGLLLAEDGFEDFARGIPRQPC